MRQIGVTFGLLAVLLTQSFTQDFNITVIAQKNGLSWEEAAAALLLAKVLDIDMTMVISTRKEAATPIFVMAPAVIIAKVSKKDLREIVKMKGKGHGWGLIAQQLGVHPGAFNKQRVALSKLNDDELVASVWISILSQAFSVPTLQIVKLQQKGLSWGDIIAALQVSSASKVPPEKVIAVWRELGKNWDKVRNRFGVSRDWLPPIKAQERISTIPKGRGKGHGHGKSRH